MEGSVVVGNVLGNAGNEEMFYAAVGPRLTRYALALDGSMREQDSVELPCAVQYVCGDLARQLLYVVCSNGGVGRQGDTHWLVVISVARAMQVQSTHVALAHRPIHASLDPQGRRLLVAYNLPAGLSVHALDCTGLPLGKPFAWFDDPQMVGWFLIKSFPCQTATRCC